MQQNVARLSFEHWYRSGEGQRCALAESRILSRMLNSLFGVCLVAIGSSAMADVIKQNSRIEQRYFIPDNELYSTPEVDLLAHPRQLPFASESIDVVMLLHTLEFDQRPKQLLEEVTRVLAPEGHLAILGFNPFSLWGIKTKVQAQLAPNSDVSGFARAKLYNIFTLRDWLASLSLATVVVEPYHWQSSFNPWLGQPGYLVSAKKRVTTLTLIRPRWRQRQLSQAGVVNRV